MGRSRRANRMPRLTFKQFALACAMGVAGASANISMTGNTFSGATGVEFSSGGVAGPQGPAGECSAEQCSPSVVTARAPTFAPSDAEVLFDNTPASDGPNRPPFAPLPVHHYKLTEDSTGAYVDCLSGNGNTKFLTDILKTESVQVHAEYLSEVGKWKNAEYLAAWTGESPIGTVRNTTHPNYGQNWGNSGLFIGKDVNYEMQIHQVYDVPTYPGGSDGDLYGSDMSDVKVISAPDFDFQSDNDGADITPKNFRSYDVVMDQGAFTPDADVVDPLWAIDAPGRITAFMNGVLIHDGVTPAMKMMYQYGNAPYDKMTLIANTNNVEVQAHNDYCNEGAIRNVWFRDLPNNEARDKGAEVTYAKERYEALKSKQIERFGPLLPEELDDSGKYPQMAAWQFPYYDRSEIVDNWAASFWPDWPLKEIGMVFNESTAEYLTQSHLSNRVTNANFGTTPSDALTIDGAGTSAFKSFQLHVTHSGSADDFVTIGGGFKVHYNGAVSYGSTTVAPLAEVGDKLYHLDVVYHAPGAYPVIDGDAEVTILVNGVATQRYLRLPAIAAEAGIFGDADEMWVRPQAAYEKTDGLDNTARAGSGFSLADVTAGSTAGTVSVHATVPAGHKFAYEIGVRDGAACTTTLSRDNAAAYDLASVTTETGSFELDVSAVDMHKQQRLYGILLDGNNKPVSRLVYKEFGNKHDQILEFGDYDAILPAAPLSRSSIKRRKAAEIPDSVFEAVGVSPFV